MLADYQPPPWLVDSISMDVRIFADQVLVTADLQVRRNPESKSGAAQAELCLDGDRLQLEELRIDGEEAEYELRREGRQLSVRAPADAFSLRTRSRLKPEQNTDLMGLYRSGDLYCTQCEPEGFRRITWYPDRPDVLSRFRVRIEADRAAQPVLLSNGNPVERGEVGEGRGEVGEGRHYVIWEDPHPKSAHLFALVAGDLQSLDDEFVTCSGRRVRLSLYAPPGRLPRLSFALKALTDAMKWDEERYGREYDLDLFQIVAVDDFNFGAMENKGLNIFNAAALYATAELTTDAGFRRIRSIVAHEYFHNWSGNRVTLRDWFQLCLKEGFTVFRDQQFSCDFEGEGPERVRQVSALRAMQFPEDAGPLAHPVRPSEYRQINNFYTFTVYEKGAELMRMLRELVSPEQFRTACDLFFSRHDGRAATVEDMLAAMSEVSGRDLRQFRRWFSGFGTPQLSAQAHWDGDRQLCRLRLQQGPGDRAEGAWQPRQIPVRAALIGAAGTPMSCGLVAGAATVPGNSDEAGAESGRGEEFVLELKDDAAEWTFTGVGERPVVSLLRGFSAPVRLQQELQDADRLRLAAARGDSFARWEAAQELYLQAIQTEMQAEMQASQPGQLAHPGLVQLWQQILPDSDVPDEMRALLLGMPPTTAAYALKPAAPVAFAEARRRLECQLAAACAPQLAEVWQSCRAALADKSYSPDPQSMGQRAMANGALRLLTLNEPDAPGHWHGVCRQQALTADNLTDRLGGLNPLLADSAEAAAEVLAHLQEQWRAEPLLLDQWFAAQARVERGETVEAVRILMDHAAFGLDNPNRVRALLGTFGGNDVAFHRADGAGYALLAEVLPEMDAINPMVAARLVAPFANCASLSSAERQRALAPLKALGERRGLSSDLAEQLLRLTADAGKT